VDPTGFNITYRGPENGAMVLFIVIKQKIFSKKRKKEILKYLF